jgi:hypothetical protein
VLVRRASTPAYLFVPTRGRACYTDSFLDLDAPRHKVMFSIGSIGSVMRSPAGNSGVGSGAAATVSLTRGRSSQFF